MFIPMELSRVLILDSSPEQFVTLAEKGGARSFAIKIGTAEAIAIERRLRGDVPPRPQTHELLESAIRALGGELEKVLIHTLEKGTFFATLLIRQEGELVEVDARPSDALALVRWMWEGGDAPPAWRRARKWSLRELVAQSTAHIAPQNQEQVLN
jgi:bifunctional DNase/RNase